MKKRSQHSKLQSFSKAAALLMLAVLTLTACEREESKHNNRNSDVRLLNPTNGIAINIDENLRIDYHGFASGAEVDVYINNILCDAVLTNDDEQPDALCALLHRPSYGIATASLMSLNGVLLQGKNYVRVVNKRNQQERQLSFQFDFESPKVYVDAVEITEASRVRAESELRNYLQAGDEIVIRGHLEDASAIRWQDRKFYVRNNISGALVQVCNNTKKDAYCVPDNPQSFCNQSCVGTFDFDDKDNTFEISGIGIEWPDFNQAKPHFSYEVRDINHQITKQDFIVNGTQLENSYALQINNRALAMLLPIGQHYLDAVNDDLLPLPLDEDGLDGIFREMGLLIGAPGVRTITGAQMVQALITGYMNYWNVGLDNTIFFSKIRRELGNYGYDEGLSWLDDALPLGGKRANMLSPLCSFLFGISNCYAEVVDVGLNNPEFLLAGVNASQYTIRTGLHFDSTTLTFKLFPRDASGNINRDRYFISRLDLNDYSLLSDFAVSKAGDQGCDSDLICLSRKPAQLVMHSSVWGNKQAFLRNSRCVGISCGERPNLLEIGWNSVTYLPKFVLWITGTTDVKNQILSIQDQLEAIFENALAGSNIEQIKISRDSDLADTFWELLTISKLSSKKTSPFPFVNYIRDGFLGFSSKTDDELVTFNQEGQVHYPSLGSVYSGKNNYSYAKNGFPNRFAGVGDLDLAYALSEDSVNQQLNMMYSKGEWDDYLFELKDFDQSLSEQLGFGISSNLCLRLSTKTAPKVKFTGYYHKLTGFQWEFSGMTLVDSNKLDRPGNVKLIFDNAKVSAYSCNDENNKFIDELLVDISVRVSMYSRNGLPIITRYESYPEQHNANFDKLHDDVPIVVRPKNIEDTVEANKIARAIEFELDKYLIGFNRTINTVTPFNLFAGEFGNNGYPKEGFEDFVTIRSLLDRNEQLSEAFKKMRKLLFKTAEDSWFRYDVKYPTYGIDPSGGYFTSILRVDRKQGIDSEGKESCKDDNRTGIHRVLCVVQE